MTQQPIQLDSSKSECPPRRGWPFWALLVIASVYLIANGVRFMLIKHSEWDEVYLLAAKHLRAGEQMYITTPDVAHVFSYPPLMALLALPFSYLPAKLDRLLWYLVNVGSLILLVRWAWNASIFRTSSRDTGFQPVQAASDVEKSTTTEISRTEHGLEAHVTSKGVRHSVLIAVLGFLCAFRFIQDSIDHQQTDLLIGALLLGGVVSLLKDRVWLAATVLGLAAGMKCTPLLFAGYLVWRGKFLPAMWLVIVAVATNLLPNLISTPPGGGLWLTVWYRELLAPLADSSHRPGDWHSNIVFNQSLSGWFNRLLTTKWSVAPDGLNVEPRVELPASVVLKRFTYGAEFVVLLGALVAFLQSRSVKLKNIGRPPIVSLECSAILLLMLLLSPMSSKPHFCTMLLPGFCLARVAIERRRSLELILLSLAIAMTYVASFNWLGKATIDLGLWAGFITFATLALLFGCYFLLVRIGDENA